MKWKSIFKYFTLIFILSICEQVESTAQGFDGKLILGFTASQIDGDNFVGFNKLGIVGGIGVDYPLINQKIKIGIELLFSQRGSQNSFNLGTPGNLIKTTLNYIEIPVLLFLRDWYIEDNSYYKVNGHFGLSYGNLISVNSNAFSNPEIINNFAKNDISIILGAGFKFTPKLELVARYNRSLNRLYNDDDIDSLVSYHWNLRLSYLL